MYYIRKELIWYFYHLGFDPEKASFLVMMRKDVFENIKSEFIKKYIETYKYDEDFGVNSFVLSKKSFGFLSCGEISVDNKDTVTISFPLTSNQGKNQIYWIAISATLSCLFEISQYLLTQTLLNESQKNDEQQSFITLSHNRGARFYGFSIHAHLSVPFTEWIRNGEMYAQQVNNRVEENCLIAFQKLTKRKGIIRGTMGLTRQGFLLSSLHGVYSSQFGILPNEVEYYREQTPFGYETFCHNTDTPLDQLVHLVGFATLLQCGREGNGK